MTPSPRSKVTQERRASGEEQPLSASRAGSDDSPRPPSASVPFPAQETDQIGTPSCQAMLPEGSPHPDHGLPQVLEGQRPGHPQSCLKTGRRTGRGTLPCLCLSHPPSPSLSLFASLCVRLGMGMVAVTWTSSLFGGHPSEIHTQKRHIFFNCR